MKAVICPICNGTGKITKTTAGTAGGTFAVDCHGCGGRGWVEVADDPEPYIPCYPPYNPYPTYIPPVYPYPYVGDPIPYYPNITYDWNWGEY